jgi:hypothetical protein
MKESKSSSVEKEWEIGAERRPCKWKEKWSYAMH